MKKLTLFLSVSCLVFLLAGCPPRTGDEPGTNGEFLASDETFANYRDWTLVATERGTHVQIGDAHAAEEPGVARYVYVKDIDMLRNDNEAFPAGTAIVKESKHDNGEVVAVTAMVKRGEGFNEDHNNWEWFMLEPGTGRIGVEDGMTMRGAQLMENMCNNCHEQASRKDYVFTWPDGNN